jgi:predicted transcriptional regulator
LDARIVCFINLSTRNCTAATSLIFTANINTSAFGRYAERQTDRLIKRGIERLEKQRVKERAEGERKEI